jgi:hypothetical protein
VCLMLAGFVFRVPCFAFRPWDLGWRVEGCGAGGRDMQSLPCMTKLVLVMQVCVNGCGGTRACRAEGWPVGKNV